MGSSAITLLESFGQQTENNDTMSQKTGPDEEYEVPWTEAPVGPLWSDFDVVLQEFDDDDVDHELDVKETSEVDVQTEKVQTSEAGVTARPETRETQAGTDDDKWKQAGEGLWCRTGDLTPTRDLTTPVTTTTTTPSTAPCRHFLKW